MNNTGDEKLAVFEKLKANLAKYSSSMSVEKDSSDNFYLNTQRPDSKNKPRFFGAVQIKKNHVSYHLMPIYCNPALIEPISASLRKRMQGKSCFNFKSVDDALFDELAALTKAAFDDYFEQGFV